MNKKNTTSIAVKIIIASRNRKESLTTTIKSIAKNKLPDGAKVSLIIAENVVKTGIEETLQTIKFPKMMRLQFCFVDVPGKSKALNYAIKKYCSHGDFILFTDDDTIVGEDWIMNYYNSIVKFKKEYFYGGGIKIPPEIVLTKLSRQPFLIASLRGIDENQDYDGLFIGPNWGAFFDALEICSFFDEKIGPGMPINLGEETFIQEKMINAGFKPKYIKQNAVTHNIQKKKITIKEILIKSYMVGRRRVHCKMENKNYWCYIYRNIKLLAFMVLYFFNKEKRFVCQFHLAYNSGVVFQKTKLAVSIKF